MNTEAQHQPGSSVIDVAIVGAGIAGLYAVYKLRSMGLKVRAFEAGSDVGGTWYWNRYPGARIDVESVEYAYTFSDELRKEWRWSERYAAQPELHAYLRHVADRFDLRKDIVFDSRVEEIVYDEERREWMLTLDKGAVVRSRFCVMATGFLSAPNTPSIEGLSSFGGKVLHTAHWPAEGVNFGGQVVGVIGTGSSGIQLISNIAEQVKELFVFQRTPNFSIPLRNQPMDENYRSYMAGQYEAWKKIAYESFGAFHTVNFKLTTPNSLSALEVTDEERAAEYESRWQSGGLSYFTSYQDLMTNQAANDTLAEFVRKKIRQKIKDPEVAEKLTPRGHPILAKRLCADTNYYEVYNRPNVHLVDVRPQGITRISTEGVVVGDKTYKLDMLIFATGFDAGTGAMTRIRIIGRKGRLLKEHWVNGPRTAMGLMSAGFPNLFIVDGPGSPGAFFNPVLLSEYHVNWIADCIRHLDDRQMHSIEATGAAEEEWVQHVNDVLQATLFPRANSWYVGANIPGKSRVSLLYAGGFKEYSRRCKAAAESGYSGFVLS
jgi:cyclohexanone monooxygenase